MSCFSERYCIAWLLLTAWLSPCLAQDGSTKVGSAVRTSLANRGAARVVVALDAPDVQKTDVPTTTLNRHVRRLQTSVRSAVDSTDFRTTLTYDSVPALVGTLTSTAALEQMAAHPDVRRIDLDVGGRGHLDTSVEIVRADHWHDDGVTGSESTVAILDSGLDTDHDDLAEDLKHQACFLQFDGEGQCPNGTTRQFGEGAAEDDHGHGTSVTGIVTSDGDRAAPGVAPNAEIVAIKVLNSENRFSSYSEIVAALDYLINHPELGVQVVNMSLLTDATFEGTCDNATSYNMAGASAVGTLRSNGVLALAASGNEGLSSEMGSPACLSEVVAVGASTLQDEVAQFTNSNSSLDLVAPGRNIQTSGRANSLVSFGGTSAATPHATGCAALLLDAGTDVSPSELESSLTTSPVRLTDPKNGLTVPRLDCYTARQQVAIDALAATPTSDAGEEAASVPYTLRWRTTLERDSRGFLVERRAGPLTPQAREEDDWTTVESVPSKAAEGRSTDTLRYEVEGTVPTAGRYAFRLRHRTENGPDDGRRTGAATSLRVPFDGSVSLGGPFPNPSRGTATIELVLQQGQDVQISLYDPLGRQVHTLYDGFLTEQTPLRLQTEGDALTSGTYFLRIRGDTFSDTRVLTIVR